MSQTDRAIRILHLEDSPRDAEIIRDRLQANGLAYDIMLVREKEAFQSALAQNAFDAILCDYNLPDYDGLTALTEVRAKSPDAPVLLISGSLGEEEAVRCLQHGATDYLLKKHLERLPSAVQRALREAEEHRQRQAAEGQLKQEAALRQSVIESAAEGICVCEEIGTPPGVLFSLWNRRMEEITGYTREEINRLGLHQTVDPDPATRARVVERMKLMREGKDLRSEEWRITRKNGEHRDLLISSRVLPGPPDRPQVLAMMHDFTEQKKLQAQLERAQRLGCIGALAGGIAHDLNNALAPVLMVARLLKEDLPTEDRLNMLATMEASARRAAEMVKQILSFARGVSGKATVLNPRHLITEIARLCKETFPRSIGVESRVEKDLRFIEGNATQLHQILLNLCVNARDAMPEGGLLRIEANNIVLDKAIAPGRPEPVSGPHIVLEVADTGCGIAPEVLGRIFEPFFTTKAPDKGTGLGLSTVQGIVKIHHGFMEVSSHVGQGTTFKVYLPASGETEIRPEHAETTDVPRGRGELILVVDDDLAILETVRQTLETFGYRVVTASNGIEALPLFRKHAAEITAVITDMMMPIMDGPAVIRLLRQIQPEVKIIGVSGLGSESVVSAAGKSSVEAFLKKPCSTQQLLETLREVVAAKS